LNPPGTPTVLNWGAIAAGAGATLAIGFSGSALLRSWIGEQGFGIGTIQAFFFLLSLVADSVGGAVAGLMARQRGALHGALAMVGASAFGMLASLVMMSRQGSLEAMFNVGYLGQWLLYALVGLGVGTLAGMVAARVAAKAS
jgi:hypothetical protein